MTARAWKEIFVNLTPNEADHLDSALCNYADKFPAHESMVREVARKMGLATTVQYIDKAKERREKQQQSLELT